MRGEDFRASLLARLTVGSPPHARGRQISITDPIAAGRITPACAGKTTFSASLAASASDHPRMRGEDPVVDKPVDNSNGSPPHARGRLGDFFVKSGDKRITPACAGKTKHRRYRQVSLSDHPRMRGEDPDSARTIACTIGSPPHARGRRLDLSENVHENGITPACAGKTTNVDFALFEEQDHPRMRGEDGPDG